MRASVQRLPARLADKATNKGGNSRFRCITTLNSGCNITIGHKLTGQSAQIQFVQKILLADLHIAGAMLLIIMRTVISHRLADWQGSLKGTRLDKCQSHTLKAQLHEMHTDVTLVIEEHPTPEFRRARVIWGP